MTQDFAVQFASEWIHAWNNKDIDGIMSHYSDDFIMISPVIQNLIGEIGGTLKGKASVREYWLKAIKKYPGLHFNLINVFVGVNSIVINYEGHRGLSSEVFYFDKQNKVNRAYAHYIQASTC